MPTSRRALGDYGESLVAARLEQQGHEIVARNWQCLQGELDIISKIDGEWVFIEVRTRRAPNTHSGIESLTPRKQQRLLAAICAYFEAQEIDVEEVPWRVDLAAVALTKNGPIIEIMHNVLGW